MNNENLAITPMVKRKLSLQVVPNVSFNHNGQNIEVRPFISPDDEVSLIKNYIDVYFNNTKKMVEFSSFDFIGAEYALNIGILQLLTSVEIIDENGKSAINYPLLVANNLMREIKFRIANYDEFEVKLYRTVSEMKEKIYNQKAIGSVIDGLVIKASIVLEQFAKVDMTPEGIAGLQDIAKTLAGSLQDSPLKPLIKESIDGVAKATKRKYTKKNKS